jgi:hypothetical protein
LLHPFDPAPAQMSLVGATRMKARDSPRLVHPAGIDRD